MVTPLGRQTAGAGAQIARYIPASFARIVPPNRAQ